MVFLAGRGHQAGTTFGDRLQSGIIAKCPQSLSRPLCIQRRQDIRRSASGSLPSQRLTSVRCRVRRRSHVVMLSRMSGDASNRNRSSRMNRRSGQRLENNGRNRRRACVGDPLNDSRRLPRWGGVDLATLGTNPRNIGLVGDSLTLGVLHRQRVFSTKGNKTDSQNGRKLTKSNHFNLI